MFNKGRSLISAVFAVAIAFSLAIDARGQVVRSELVTLAHLAQFSAPAADHPHDSGSGHAHRHRHSPNEPEHEHSHGGPALIGTIAFDAPMPVATLPKAIPLDGGSRLLPSSDSLPLDSTLTSILRPPIA
jgi:hypothetical protein